MSGAGAVWELFTLGNSFLHSTSSSWAGSRLVSIPFTSGNSFLLINFYIAAPINKCVNPLHLGELISTAILVSPKINGLLCQSPSPRGTHFYANFCICCKYLSTLCQSPSPRGTHFYARMKNVEEWQELCQSPSPRGTHFYPPPYFLLNLCGFPASISGVFSRQFWKRLFFRSLQHF